MIAELRLRALLNYDSETGIFSWRIRNGKMIAGQIAGSTSHKFGYRYIVVKGHRIAAHRLAWLFVHGQWPSSVIDHINGNTDDNRIENLREATRQQNSRNARLCATNKSGFKGVSWDKRRNTWKACIQIDRKTKMIGRYADAKDAARAYEESALLHYGEFARLR